MPADFGAVAAEREFGIDVVKAQFPAWSVGFSGHSAEGVEDFEERNVLVIVAVGNGKGIAGGGGEDGKPLFVGRARGVLEHEQTEKQQNGSANARAESDAGGGGQTQPFTVKDVKVRVNQGCGGWRGDVGVCFRRVKPSPELLVMEFGDGRRGEPRLYLAIQDYSSA